VFEFKKAAKSFTVTEAYVAKLYRQAAVQKKRAVLVLTFPTHVVTMEIQRTSVVATDD
jgi:hypothetical protein